MNPRKLARPSVVLAMLLHSLTAIASDGWPGLPPDCWAESRVVHGQADYDDRWRDAVTSQRVDAIGPLVGVVAPNHGYAFVIDRVDDNYVIRVDAEKPQQTRLAFAQALALDEVRWINEKLIFGRVWWGRIAATDFIFDVEAESFVWHQSATESEIAMSQARQSCPFVGCRCIPQRSE